MQWCVSKKHLLTLCGLFGAASQHFQSKVARHNKMAATVLVTVGIRMLNGVFFNTFLTKYGEICFCGGKQKSK